MEWKQYKDTYLEVSDTGRVRTMDRISEGPHGSKRHYKSKERVISENEKGYGFVTCYFDKQVKTFMVHRMVAETFLPNPDNKENVSHIDGNHTNNNVDNLEWNTLSESGKKSYFTRYLNEYDNSAMIANEIRKDKGNGFTNKQLSKKYNLNIRKIGSIVRNEQYTDPNYKTPKKLKSKYSKNIIEKAKMMYFKEGKSQSKIGSELSVPQPVVSKMIRGAYNV